MAKVRQEVPVVAPPRGNRELIQQHAPELLRGEVLTADQILAELAAAVGSGRPSLRTTEPSFGPSKLKEELRVRPGTDLLADAGSQPSKPVETEEFGGRRRWNYRIRGTKEPFRDVGPGSADQGLFLGTVRIIASAIALSPQIPLWVGVKAADLFTHHVVVPLTGSPEGKIRIGTNVDEMRRRENERRRREYHDKTIGWEDKKKAVEELKEDRVPSLTQAQESLVAVVKAAVKQTGRNNFKLGAGLAEGSNLQERYRRTFEGAIGDLAKAGVRPEEFIGPAEKNAFVNSHGERGTEQALWVGAKLAREYIGETFMKWAIRELDKVEVQREVLKAPGFFSRHAYNGGAKSYRNYRGALESILDEAAGLANGATTEQVQQSIAALSFLGERAMQVIKEYEELVLRTEGDFDQNGILARLEAIKDAATPGVGDTREEARGGNRQKQSVEAQAAVKTHKLLRPMDQALLGVAVLGEGFRAVLKYGSLGVEGGPNSRVIDHSDTQLLGAAVEAEFLQSDDGTPGVKQDMLHPQAAQTIALGTSPEPARHPESASPKQRAALDALIFTDHLFLEPVEEILAEAVRLGKSQLPTHGNEVAILMATLAAGAEMKIPPEGLPTRFAESLAVASGELAAEALSQLPQFAETGTKTKLMLESAQALRDLFGPAQGDETAANLCVQHMDRLARLGLEHGACQYTVSLLKSAAEHLPREIAWAMIKPLAKRLTKEPNIAVDSKIVGIFEALSHHNSYPENPQTLSDRSRRTAQIVGALIRKRIEDRVDQAAAKLVAPELGYFSFNAQKDLLLTLPKASPELLSLQGTLEVPLMGPMAGRANIPVSQLEILDKPIAYQPGSDLLGLQALGIMEMRPVFRHEAAIAAYVHQIRTMLDTVISSERGTQALAEYQKNLEQAFASVSGEEDEIEEAAWAAPSKATLDEVTNRLFSALEDAGLLRKENVVLIRSAMTVFRHAGLSARLTPKAGLTLRIEPDSEPPFWIQQMEADSKTRGVLGRIEASLRAGQPTEVPLDTIRYWAEQLAQRKRSAEAEYFAQLTRPL